MLFAYFLTRHFDVSRMLVQVGPKLAAEVVNAVFVQQTMKTASSDEDLAFKQCLGKNGWDTRRLPKPFVSQPRLKSANKKECERSKQCNKNRCIALNLIMFGYCEDLILIVYRNICSNVCG